MKYTDPEPAIRKSTERYQPPDDAAVEALAQSVCQHLVDSGQLHFASSEVSWQLAALLRLTADLTVKAFNRTRCSTIDEIVHSDYAVQE